MNHAYILTLSCPDRPGIVHAVSGFLLERGGNIEEAAQYNDHDTGLFFMRVQFACDQLTLEDLKLQLKSFAEPFKMVWKLHGTHQPMRAVIMVSKEGHCLQRPAVPLEKRPAAAGDRGHHFQPSRFLPARGRLQRAVPPHTGDRGHQGAGRGQAV